MPLNAYFSLSPPIPPLCTSKQTNVPIVFVAQFFVHSNPKRHNEIKYCLRQNVLNPFIETIYLLNERIYSDEELGVTNPKIKQLVIGSRLLFSDIFDFIETESINAIVVFANSDIMLDSTIEKLFYTSIFEQKTMIALLRYEYKNNYVPFETNCNQISFFGPRAASQDTWIIHSKDNIPKERRPMFAFPFGKPGCDNKMIYLFHMLNYIVYNDPTTIRTYHYHTTEIRDYTSKDRLQPIFEYMCPAGLTDVVYTYVPAGTLNYNLFNLEDNRRFKNKLTQWIEKETKFVVPLVNALNINGKFYDDIFFHTEYYFSRDIHDMEFGPLISIENHIFHETKTQKTRVWDALRYICHFIYLDPWTLSLAGKRILIVSPYAGKMKQNQHNNYYPVDIFKNNTFLFLEHQNHSPNEFHKTITTIQNRKEEFDVAFVDYGEVTNLLSNEIYKMNKSAISLGDGLGLMFGLYTAQQLEMFQDFFNGFLNEHWIRI